MHCPSVLIILWNDFPADGAEAPAATLTRIPIQSPSWVYPSFYGHLATLTFCKLYGETLMISETRVR